jgi:hypothetical protein
MTFYWIGLVLHLFVMALQLKAAQEVVATSIILPIIWWATGAGFLMFAFDSMPNMYYAIYFGLNTVIMFTAGTIVWKKRLR